MKVLILTDSLSLPRKHDEGIVFWEDIYYTKLKIHFPEVEFILMAQGGGTITHIKLALNYYQHVNPDIIILQSGIVDCAPRALSQLEQQIIIKLRLFRIIHPLTGFLRKYRRISYTTPKKFEQELKAIKKVFDGKPLIAIGILPGCKAYDLKVSNVSNQIKRYNDILKKHAIFIDNSDFPREGIASDFHHLNNYGHEIVFKKLALLIDSFISENRIHHN